jgi:N-acetylgalactosamine-6-sulfatase
MIERMDAGIGKILAAIDRLGLTERTLVIFTSDNGGTRSGRNAPYSGFKGSTHEGGIRVPAIARWPGVLAAGIESDQPYATFDFTASIARIAEAPPAQDKPFDGVDILKHVAEKKPNIDRTLYWRKPRGNEIWKGARDGSLKYIGHASGDRQEEFLYDLAADPTEQRDLQRERPDDFARLRDQYNRWERDVRRDRRR